MSGEVQSESTAFRGVEAMLDAFISSLPDDQVHINIRTGAGLAGAQDWHSLNEHPAWKDLAQCLKDSIEEAQSELEECPLSRIPQVRGMIKAYRAVLAIPEQSVRELDEPEERSPSDE